MLRSQRLVVFVPTTDRTRALAFYRDTLGLERVAGDENAITFHANGTTLRLHEVREWVPSPFPTIGWHVPDLAASTNALAKRGVAFEEGAGLKRDARGSGTLTEGATQAWFKDPDGNVLSLTEASSEPRSENIIPEMFVHDGPGALAFYREAFGATELSRMMTKDGGKLIHGEIEIVGHRLFVCDEFTAAEGGTCRCPRTLGGTAVRITLQVDDADAVVAQAVAAGATVTMPVQDLFWGARYGKLTDPYGHEWGINQQVQVLTPAEEAERSREYFAKS